MYIPTIQTRLSKQENSKKIKQHKQNPTLGTPNNLEVIGILLITNRRPVLQCPFWIGKQFAERWGNEKDFISRKKPSGISKQAQMCFCQWGAVISITFPSQPALPACVPSTALPAAELAGSCQRPLHAQMLPNHKSQLHNYQLRCLPSNQTHHSL